MHYEDLTFKPHPIVEFAEHALVFFDNGWGASVIYHGMTGELELGVICPDDMSMRIGIHNYVLVGEPYRYLKMPEVTALLVEIEAREPIERIDPV